MFLHAFQIFKNNRQAYFRNLKYKNKLLLFFYIIFLETCVFNTFRVTEEYAPLKRVILVYVFLKRYFQSQIIMFQNIIQKYKTIGKQILEIRHD